MDGMGVLWHMYGEGRIWLAVLWHMYEEDIVLWLGGKYSAVAYVWCMSIRKI